MFDVDELLTAYATPDLGEPWIRANFIASLDGAGTREGRTAPLNDEWDHAVFHTLRAMCDVLLVGAGTVRDEGYGPVRVPEPAVARRRAEGRPDQPTLALVSGRLDLDPAAPVLAEAPVRPLVLTHDGAPSAARAALAGVADVINCGRDAVDMHRVRAELGERGLHQVLTEGGPTLFGALVEADILDELDLTLSPTIESGDAGRIVHGHPLTPRPMRLEKVFQGGPMLFTRYVRDR